MRMSNLFFCIVLIIGASIPVVVVYAQDIVFDYDYDRLQQFDKKVERSDIKVYEPKYNLYKDFKVIKKKPIKKGDRINRLARKLYNKKQNELREWFYIWSELAKAKKEQIHEKDTNE